MKLHLIALPHTRVAPESCGCAYTAKLLKFCRMMAPRGHEIVLYAPEGSDVEHVELVQTLSDEERVGIFGLDDPSRLPAWPTDEQSRLFNARAVVGLIEQAGPDDLVLISMGRTHKPIVDALPHLWFCEPGVGYEGIFVPRCAFESYAWLHHVYAKSGITDGRNFDAVIPNYFDPAEFPRLNGGGGDYLLFLGRVIGRKGLNVAAAVAATAGMRLVVAGAGATAHGPGFVESPDAGRIECPDLEYVGPVNVAERAELLAGARALLAPTAYIEPFGGVAVEAMMAGTPALTTDWGAFTETVEQGVSGFRFRTLAEGVDAVERAGELYPEAIREYARQRYSLDAVAPQFEKWFARIETLRGAGWYAMPSAA